MMQLGQSVPIPTARWITDLLLTTVGGGRLSTGSLRPRYWRCVSIFECRRWSSNPSGKCSYERPTRGTVCGTMRSMCGAGAGCLAINYQSLHIREQRGIAGWARPAPSKAPLLGRPDPSSTPPRSEIYSVPSTLFPLPFSLYHIPSALYPVP